VYHKAATPSLMLCRSRLLSSLARIYCLVVSALIRHLAYSVFGGNWVRLSNFDRAAIRHTGFEIQTLTRPVYLISSSLSDHVVPSRAQSFCFSLQTSAGVYRRPGAGIYLLRGNVETNATPTLAFLEPNHPCISALTSEHLVRKRVTTKARTIDPLVDHPILIHFATSSL